MARYIPKDALVAEIENLLDKGRYHEEYDCAYRDGNNSALYALKGKIDTLEVKEVQEEPVSEDLEEVSKKYALNNTPYEDCTDEMSDAFKAGARWQEEKDNEEKVLIYKHGFDDCKEQFEKNRLAACDRQTAEDAERESDFVMSVIEKEHRQPTFDDAIKYGMRLQEQQMMARAVDCEVWDEEPPHITYFPKDMKGHDKCKLIIIKEG